MLRTNDATPTPPQPKPMIHLLQKYGQKLDTAALIADPSPPITSDRYIAGFRPRRSASCPINPAPKKNPAKNIESADETFQASPQTRFHSDRMEADLETHSHSSWFRLQKSRSSHPSRTTQRHAGSLSVNTDIRVMNTAGTQATDDNRKCHICALPISPTCREITSSTVSSPSREGWGESSSSK